MRKQAQYPYDQLGLAPGLPDEVEQSAYAQQPQSESGWPSWALPAGAAASGILGYLLLKKRGKVLEEAAAKALKPAEAAASKSHPMEAWAQKHPAMQTSQAYPGSAIGVHAGDTARASLESHPKALMNELKNLQDWSFLRRDNVNPKEILNQLNELAKAPK